MLVGLLGGKCASYDANDIRAHSTTAWKFGGNLLISGFALTIAKIWVRPSALIINQLKCSIRSCFKYDIPSPMISVLTFLTAPRKASIRVAISLANFFLPSSLAISASSLDFASSNSSGERVVGPDNKKCRRTGEEPMVDEPSKECK